MWRTGEPQARASGVSRGRAEPSAQEAETLRASGTALETANQEWALDFVHDAVDCGRTIRVLSVVDAYTRECLEAVKESNNALSFGTVQAH